MIAYSPAWADSETYSSLRQRNKPVVISDLSTVTTQSARFTTQAVELTGRVSGMLRDQVLNTVLFKLESGQTLNLLARPEQSVLQVGQRALALARLTESPSEVVCFNLLAMTEAPPPAEPPIVFAAPAQQPTPAPGPAVASPPPQPQPALQPRYALSSRGGAQSLNEQLILSAYANAIAYFNPRLSEKKRYAIAQYIIDYSRHAGVDARLVMAVVACESNFNQYATSRTGAMGLGQLMPATARGMGVGNAYDTRENLWAAIRLVRGHLANNDGDLALALACYNAGAGAVRKYGGVPPYRETRNYIRKVTSLYQQLAPEMVAR